MDKIQYIPLSKRDELVYETVISNNETSITTDNIINDVFYNIAKELNLTVKETTVLQLRLSGNKYKAISAYLRLTDNNLIRIIRRLSQKINKLNERK